VEILTCVSYNPVRTQRRTNWQFGALALFLLGVPATPPNLILDQTLRDLTRAGKV